MSEFYHINIAFDISSDKSNSEIFKIVSKEVDNLLIGTILSNKRISVRKLKKNNKTKITLGEFKLEDVLPHICDKNKKEKKDFICDGKTYSIKMNRSRYLVFRNDLKCKACGLAGAKFLLETYQENSSPHFNLYGVEDGSNILMTKDHVIPRSKGGPNKLENYITMCVICNNLKGDDDLTMEEINILRGCFNKYKDVGKKERANLINEIRMNILKGKNKCISDPLVS